MEIKNIKEKISSFFDNSPLYWLCFPIKNFTSDIRQPSVYEHVFAPIVVLALVKSGIRFISYNIICVPRIVFFTIVIVTCFWHFVIKELIVDMVLSKKPFNKNDVAQRLYGVFLACILLII